MYEHINGIEKINILCTLLLILVGEYIFYYCYKKGTLKGISKIYFDINEGRLLIFLDKNFVSKRGAKAICHNRL